MLGSKTRVITRGINAQKQLLLLLFKTPLLAKGAGSYSGQGGRIARKGHPGRRKRIACSSGKSRAAGANRGQWGLIVQKRHFPMFFIISFLLILAKHKKISTLLPPWAKGNRGSHILWPHCPATLAQFINFD